MSILKEKCPKALKSINLSSLTGYKLACDASMSIYQFLISTQGFTAGFGLSELTDKDGNRTGHLVGLLNRSILMIESGIRPIWVFDGKPPDLKMTLLEERKKKKIEAAEKLETAETEEDVLKYAGQTIKITPQMTADAKKLVSLLGLPVVEAPYEAEAQCTSLVREGLAYGVVSEDMDCLTFGTPYLIKGLGGKENVITQIDLKMILSELDITMDQFIDICILCGCDYTGSIDNIGPVKALTYIKEHKNIEGVIKHVDEENVNDKKKKKFSYNLDNFKYNEARSLFKEPGVNKGETFNVRLLFTKFIII